MEFTVMTYNIQSGRNLAQDRNIAHAISAIQKESPDILSLKGLEPAVPFFLWYIRNRENLNFLKGEPGQEGIAILTSHKVNERPKWK